jgi:lysophospholipid acyltransferase
VKDLPSILELLSYVFYCQACALGVFFEFSDYKRFIEETHEYKSVPNPILPSMKWILQGFACLAISMVGNSYLPLDYTWNPDFVTLAFPMRIAYYYMSMQFKKFFYYNPFSFTTAAIISSGLGYNGKDKEGNDKWDKVVSVYIWELETANSPIEMLRFWNHQVHLWLKFYVMGRLCAPGKRPGAFENMMTFIVSAFWHGFYPFYYVLFFFAALLVEVSKDIFKARYLFRFIPSVLRPVVANLVSMVIMNYLGIL